MAIAGHRKINLSEGRAVAYVYGYTELKLAPYRQVNQLSKVVAYGKRAALRHVQEQLSEEEDYLVATLPFGGKESE